MSYGEAYRNKSMSELQEARLAIENNPENRNPHGSFYIYKPTARLKLEKIAWAITHLLAKQKAAKT